MPPARPPVSVADRFRGERILLTGATGFLAKSILEKIVRAIPDVAQIYLLVRRCQRTSAAERVEREVISSSIFDRLRHTQGTRFADVMREKITAVEGDLGEDRLGLPDQAYDELARAVTCVINSAAACSFGEQLDRALQVNTIGPQRILQFAKDAGDIPLVHVSTCYVSGIREDDIPEDVLPLGHTVSTYIKGAKPTFHLDAEVQSMLAQCTEIRSAVADGERDEQVFADAYPSTYASDKIARERRDFADSAVVNLGKRLARFHGWTDTYPFTKALGEQLLVRERGSVPLVILRPSIIESSYDEPMPGWIDGLRMADPLITEAGKGNLPTFVGRADATLDLVPCDMVTNAILAAIPPAGALDWCEIYQIGSGHRNPLSLRQLSEMVYEAFTRRPSYDRAGEPLQATSCQCIPGHEFKRKLYRRMRHMQLVRDLYTRVGAKARARQARLTLRVLGRLRDFADLYGFYTSHSPRFLTDKTDALWGALSDEDRALFPFDTTRIDWHDYIVERHVPGLQRMAGSKMRSKRTMHPRTLHRIADVRCLFDLYERTAEIYGDCTATQVCRSDTATGWVRYTYRQLVDAAAHVHTQLAELGLKVGDRIIIYSESNPEWVFAYMGAQRAGLVAVPLDPQLTPEEVSDIVTHTNAKLILVGRQTHRAFPTNGRNGPQPPVVRLQHPFVPDPTQPADPHASAPPPKQIRGPDDPASIIFVNGTTHPPKPVVLSHAECLSRVRESLSNGEQEAEESMISAPRMRDDDDFSRRIVSAFAQGACVSYIDQFA